MFCVTLLLTRMLKNVINRVIPVLSGTYFTKRKTILANDQESEANRRYWKSYDDWRIGYIFVF